MISFQKYTISCIIKLRIKNVTRRKKDKYSSLFPPLPSDYSLSILSRMSISRADRSEIERERGEALREWVNSRVKDASFKKCITVNVLGVLLP